MSLLKLDYTTTQGSEYIIEFSPFETDLINEDIEVIDLVLKQNLDNGVDNYELHNFLSQQVLEYLDNHEDQVIYFYCDNAPITKSERNSHYSNQEFRNKLFTSMFERLKRNAKNQGSSFDYFHRNTVVKDPENGDHFISLLSKRENSEKVEYISNSITSINDK